MRLRESTFDLEPRHLIIITAPNANTKRDGGMRRRLNQLHVLF
jgi:hypothetical protein